MCVCARQYFVYTVWIYIPFKHFRRCSFRLQWKMQILYSHRKVKKEWCREDEQNRRILWDKKNRMTDKSIEIHGKCVNYARIITIFNFITSIEWNSKITWSFQISNWMHSDYRKSFCTYCDKRNEVCSYFQFHFLGANTKIYSRQSIKLIHVITFFSCSLWTISVVWYFLGYSFEII